MQKHTFLGTLLDTSLGTSIWQKVIHGPLLILNTCSIHAVDDGPLFSASLPDLSLETYFSVFLMISRSSPFGLKFLTLPSNPLPLLSIPANGIFIPPSLKTWVSSQTCSSPLGPSASCQQCCHHYLLYPFQSFLHLHSHCWSLAHNLQRVPKPHKMKSSFSTRF